MILQEQEIIKLASAETDKWIKEARADSDRYMLHFYGKDTTQFLTQIEGLENDRQLELRKKHAIANNYLINNLINPYSNVFSAKGGRVDLGVSDSQRERAIAYLSDVRGGLSLKEYSKNILFDNYMTDPNGLTWVEISENKETYLTHKSIFKIKNMEVDGVNPKYVVFEPVKLDDKGNNIVVIVDDANYYKCIVKGDSAINVIGNDNNTAVIVEVIPNSFGYVPAVQNSPNLDTLRKIKISPLYSVLDMLDNFLVNHSVKEIYYFLHGYPIFWMYATPCKTCNGTRYVDGEVCPSCNGTGHTASKDVSDILALKTPENADDPTIAPDVAGYVQPDLETLREMREELKYKYNELFFSLWGTHTEQGTNETATGRFIDVQPVENKLSEGADVFEMLESKLSSIILTYHFITPIESHVTIGRRFILETPDKLMQTYIDSKEKNAPIWMLNELLLRYIESEHKKNLKLQEYSIKMMRYEPFVHLTLEQVTSLNIPQIDKGKKIYFNEFISQFTIEQVLAMSDEQFNNQFIKYVEDATTKESD